MSSGEENSVELLVTIYRGTLLPHSLIVTASAFIVGLSLEISFLLYLFLILLAFGEMMAASAIMRVYFKKSKDQAVASALILLTTPIFLFTMAAYNLRPEESAFIPYILLGLVSIPLSFIIYEIHENIVRFFHELQLPSKLKTIASALRAQFALIVILTTITASSWFWLPIASSVEFLDLFASILGIVLAFVITLLRNKWYRRKDSLLESIHGEHIRFPKELSQNVILNQRIAKKIQSSFPNFIRISDLSRELDVSQALLSRRLYALRSLLNVTEEGLQLNQDGVAWIRDLPAKPQGFLEDDIEIEYLYFHCLDSRKKPASLGKGSIRKPDSADTKRIYKKYFSEIARKPESRRCYTLSKSKNEQFEIMYKLLDELRLADVLTDEDNILFRCTQLVSELLDYGSNRVSISGVLILGIFTVNDKRYVGVLVLDWVDGPLVEFDEGRLSPSLRRISRALPASGRFRKGAIFPHPEERGYMKICQNDVATDYFDALFGGLPPLRADILMREISKIVYKLQGALDYEQSVELYSHLMNHFHKNKNEIDGEAISSIINLVLPNTNASRIHKFVNERFKDIGLVNVLELEYLTLSIDIDDIRVKGPIQSLMKRFHVDESDTGKHVVEGKITRIRHNRG